MEENKAKASDDVSDLDTMFVEDMKGFDSFGVKSVLDNWPIRVLIFETPLHTTE